MAKKRINKFLPIAYEGIVKSELTKDDKLEEDKLTKKYQAQIASFGAAVNMGSLLSAIAFFSNKGGADVKRQELMKLIYYIIKNGEVEYNKIKNNCLFKYVNDKESGKEDVKQEVLDAAIAIKLTLNLFIEDKGDA